jgi:MFS family permease
LWLDDNDFNQAPTINIDYSGFLFCRIGRKKTLFLSFGLALGSSVGVAFSPSYPVFVALRFLVGFSTAGIFMTAFVIGNNEMSNVARTHVCVTCG